MFPAFCGAGSELAAHGFFVLLNLANAISRLKAVIMTKEQK